MDITSVTASGFALEGMKKAQIQLAETAQNIAEGSLDPQDLVSLSLADLQFKANATVLKAENEVLKAALDIKV
jgi:hypothetical protein